ncbi:hypothetical protein [Ornithinimicrobium pratense]|uniref:Uncharacterized protein n=1 Tax=Ornithinimicrobium pratense TaxID=2593973 RepID=A0A5J6V9R4_9MICO|nr:hypothetical protein [Ornithinimicrobium pratense]QFG69782.1 hypothetical protein FY030_14705 [Ornithinimicrobium pratense]
MVVPLVSMVGIYLLWVVYPSGYLWGTAEDSLVEWMTVVCYLAAAAVAAVLVPRWWRRGRRLTAIAYVVLCLGFLVIAGEEVSWGQRVLGFEGPSALVEANLQDEANLHNLLDRYALHGLYIVIGVWGVGVGRWVVSRVAWLQPGYAYAPSKDLLWWFLPALVYYLYVDYGVPAAGVAGVALGEGPPRFQEPVELLLGAGFLLFMVEVWLRGACARQPALTSASQASPTRGPRVRI